MTSYSKTKKRLKAKLLRAKSTMAKLSGTPKKGVTNMGVPTMHTAASVSKKIAALEVQLCEHIAAEGNEVPRKRSAA